MEGKHAEVYGEEPPPSYEESQQPELQPMYPKQPYGEQGYVAPGTGYPQQPYQQQQQQQGYPVTQQPVGSGPAGQAHVVIISPGQPLTNPPDSHLGLAIFVTICCCWPIGLFAIMRASSCKNAIGRGDQADADRYSKDAKKFSMWAIGVGLVLNLMTIAVYVVMGLAS